jgi:hypothetical protein
MRSAFEGLDGTQVPIGEEGSVLSCSNSQTTTTASCEATASIRVHLPASSRRPCPSPSTALVPPLSTTYRLYPPSRTQTTSHRNSNSHTLSYDRLLAQLDAKAASSRSRAIARSSHLTDARLTRAMRLKVDLWIVNRGAVVLKLETELLGGELKRKMKVRGCWSEYLLKSC